MPEELVRAADALADAAMGATDKWSARIEDVRREGEAVTFSIDGVRYCAVVELDEDTH